MKKIFKYVLNATDTQTINIPSKKILSVEEQKGEVVVYALVDDEMAPIIYEFEVRATGQPIEFDVDSFKFLGTVKLDNGNLMFHIFFREKVEESY